MKKQIHQPHCYTAKTIIKRFHGLEVELKVMAPADDAFCFVKFSKISKHTCTPDELRMLGEYLVHISNDLKSEFDENGRRLRWVRGIARYNDLRFIRHGLELVVLKENKKIHEERFLHSEKLIQWCEKNCEKL